MDDLKVRYCFTLADGTEEVFDLQLDKENTALLGASPSDLPPWTQLTFHQCPNCPLSADTQEHCPAAVRLVDVVSRLGGLLSYEKIQIRVTTKERTIIQDTTAQRALSALFGLIMATSGCPHTAFFKPMARFHLPLASEEETTYRAVSMYMLGQYFVCREGGTPDYRLEGLAEIYENVQIVNCAIAGRLGAASEKDSTVNAVILLDLYAQTVPIVIEESLAEIRHLFAPFLSKDTHPSLAE